MNWLRYALAALATLKLVDLADRLPLYVGTTAAALLMAAWAATALGIACGYRPAGYTLAALALTVGAAGMLNQHLYLFAWLGIITALDQTVPRETLLAALRWQTTIVYGFAAFNKLTPAFLSGDVLSRQIPVALPVSMLIAMSVATIAAEAALPVLLWHRPNLACRFGIAMHAAIVAGTADGSVSVARLSVFAGLLLVMYPAFLSRPARLTDPALTLQPIGAAA